MSAVFRGGAQHEVWSDLAWSKALPDAKMHEKGPQRGAQMRFGRRLRGSWKAVAWLMSNALPIQTWGIKPGMHRKGGTRPTPPLVTCGHCLPNRKCQLQRHVQPTATSHPHTFLGCSIMIYDLANQLTNPYDALYFSLRTNPRVSTASLY